tara:strand:+ start:1106 stop:1300 length:195 start_codon:yes stop_codon:yes gene_type:complete
MLNMQKKKWLLKGSSQFLNAEIESKARFTTNYGNDLQVTWPSLKLFTAAHPCCCGVWLWLLRTQ